MRIARFGIVALAFALGYSSFLAWRLLYPPVVTISRVDPRPADIQSVKSDLCRLGHSERKYLNATGHYAGPYELASNGEFSMPQERWPYLYYISVPVPDRCVVVAIPFRTLGRRLPVLTMSHTLKVCQLSPNAPNVAWNPETRSHDSSDIETDFDCEPCPPVP